MDPCQKPRLIEIIQNLRERIREARGNGWLGEVEGLQVSLDAATAKLNSLSRAPADGRPNWSTSACPSSPTLHRRLRENWRTRGPGLSLSWSHKPAAVSIRYIWVGRSAGLAAASSTTWGSGSESRCSSNASVMLG